MSCLIAATSESNSAGTCDGDGVGREEGWQLGWGMAKGLKEEPWSHGAGKWRYRPNHRQGHRDTAPTSKSKAGTLGRSRQTSGPNIPCYYKRLFAAYPGYYSVVVIITRQSLRTRAAADFSAANFF